MAHKCFISFKKEDIEYKKEIQTKLGESMIDKSLDDAIDSDDEDYIMKIISKDYLSDSTVTIFLIGAHSAENLGWEEQKYIKRELRASLHDREGNSKNGILGVVLPIAYSKIYTGAGTCDNCKTTLSYVNINDSTVIKEFSYNYFIPHDGCHYTTDQRYCELVRWDDFYEDPEKYIDRAFEKRNHEISKRTKVRPE